MSHHTTLYAAIAFLRKDPAQIAYVEGVYKSQLSNNIFDKCRFGDFIKSHWPKRTKDVEQAPNVEVERGTTFDFVHRDALSYYLESIGRSSSPRSLRRTTACRGSTSPASRGRRSGGRTTS